MPTPYGFVFSVRVSRRDGKVSVVPEDGMDALSNCQRHVWDLGGTFGTQENNLTFRLRFLLAPYFDGRIRACEARGVVGGVGMEAYSCISHHGDKPFLGVAIWYLSPRVPPPYFLLTTSLVKHFEWSSIGSKHIMRHLIPQREAGGMGWNGYGMWSWGVHVYMPKYSTFFDIFARVQHYSSRFLSSNSLHQKVPLSNSNPNPNPNSNLSPNPYANAPTLTNPHLNRA
eukprot:1392520-Amorphochlora_amoeboformis.AAC.1